MPMRHRHRVGRHLVVDDESGITYYDDQIFKRWDGALVSRKAMEPRQPQEFVKARNDPKALKDVRPAQTIEVSGVGPHFFVGNTTVPAEQGIGYRLTQTGIGKMEVGGDFVVQGEIDDISVTAAPLKYDPNQVVPLTNPTTYNITATTTATRTIHLAVNEHAIITIASGKDTVEGMCRIIGEGSGNSVWVIGGSITNQSSASISGEDHSCLNISNVEKCYVEGVRLDKRSAFGDALIFRGSAQPGGTLWLQNSFLSGGQSVSAAGLHGDGFQIGSQVKGLNVYNVTIQGYNQGFLVNSSLQNQFVSGAAIVNGATFDKVNTTMRARSTFGTSATYTVYHSLYLQDDCALEPITYTLTGVYAHDQQGTLKVGSLCRPGVQGSNQIAAACGNIETWDTCYWPAARMITGEVKQGLPPGGHYVPLTFSGLNYVSPGYRST